MTKPSFQRSHSMTDWCNDAPDTTTTTTFTLPTFSTWRLLKPGQAVFRRLWCFWSRKREPGLAWCATRLHVEAFISRPAEGMVKAKSRSLFRISSAGHGEMDLNLHIFGPL